MLSSNAIRDKLISYSLGEMQLHKLEERVVAESWNVHKSGNREAADLAYSVELLLAEYSNGHRTEEELREEFRRTRNGIRVMRSSST